MKKRILNITFAALFTAITAALSQAAIPTPFGVPLTLQTFAVALCGYVLGIKWGLASIITYILLGVFYRRVYFRLFVFGGVLRRCRNN